MIKGAEKWLVGVRGSGDIIDPETNKVLIWGGETIQEENIPILKS